MSNRRVITSKAFTNHNKVELVRGGKNYFDLLIQLINRAKDCIHLQTYIFDDDETGRMVGKALMEAAGRNVRIYFIADGFASQFISSAYITELKNTGIHFRFFEPLLKSKHFYFGRRMHHKVVVIDMKYALVGGVNIANRYNDLSDKPAWLDFALFAEGEIAQHLWIHCWKMWKGFQNKTIDSVCKKEPSDLAFEPEQQIKVRMRSNDWVDGKNEISGSYFEMFRTAKTDITILCSYFLPGKKIRRLMAAAVKRGVRIRIVAAGPSDVMVAKFAERWLYDWLLRKGITLYEYQKNVLHGKIAVCDDRWMTIGSYNINNISAFATIELNLDVDNAAFAKKTRLTLEDIIQRDCVEVTIESHQKSKNIFSQFIRWLSYQFIRTVFYLFTFYFKQQH